MKVPAKFPVLIKRGSVVVKIYLEQAGGYTRYSVDFNDGVKRRRKRFADYSKAKSEADLVAAKLAAGEADALQLSGHDRKVYFHAVKVCASVGVALDVAAERYARAHSAIPSVPLDDVVQFYLRKHPSNLNPATVAQVVDELILTKQRDGRSYSYVNDLKKLRPFARAFQCQLASVTGAQIDEWLRSLKLSPRSRNNGRKRISTLMAFAKRKKYLPADHAEMSEVETATDQGKEIEIFTPDEMANILEHAQPHMLPFLSVGAFAGVRHWEIKRLNWSHIRLDEGFIEITQGKAKTRSRRTVPVTPALEQWLRPFAQPSGPVCPYANMSEELMVMAADLGIRWKRNGLRHSFISYRMALIKNETQVAYEAGNSPAIIYRNYHQLVQPADAERWFSIRPTKTPDQLVVPAFLRAKLSTIRPQEKGSNP